MIRSRACFRPLALAAVLAVGLAACGTDDALQDEVDALRAAAEQRADDEAELEERVEALETELEALLAPVGEDDDEVEDPFLALRTSLDELEDRLTALDASAATTDDATAAARAAADAAASDLRTSLDEVRSANETVRGEVEELRTLYESLRDRLDRQDRERR